MSHGEETCLSETLHRSVTLSDCVVLAFQHEYAESPIQETNNFQELKSDLLVVPSVSTKIDRMYRALLHAVA